MVTRIPTASQNAHADLEAQRTDAGPAAGYVEVYTGSQPATANDAATGTLLVSITLNDPAYGAAAGGVANLDVSTVPEGPAVADGTPGWYRVYDSAGATVRDGSLSAAAAITAGEVIQITGATLTMPATT